ncbi:hypothetical protein EVAR_32476_1 [Eumeta japonica]|uniref:Uncharacterized protein n=1 Tax=Eumeta variegata TaxID=151549 RepID=A0A4C1VMA9_EUMVA|nr:hypothetical protein EVAR_32476_1 [Eumeta japonica]
MNMQRQRAALSDESATGREKPEKTPVKHDGARPKGLSLYVRQFDAEWMNGISKDRKSEKGYICDLEILHICIERLEDTNCNATRKRILMHLLSVLNSSAV